MKLLIHLLVTIGLFIYIPEWGSSDNRSIDEQYAVAPVKKTIKKQRVIIPAPKSQPKKPAQVYERKILPKPKTITPISQPSQHKGIQVLTGTK